MNAYLGFHRTWFSVVLFLLCVVWDLKALVFEADGLQNNKLIADPLHPQRISKQALATRKPGMPALLALLFYHSRLMFVEFVTTVLVRHWALLHQQMGKNRPNEEHLNDKIARAPPPPQINRHNIAVYFTQRAATSSVIFFLSEVEMVHIIISPRTLK